jgi:hypothetical protein
LGPQGAAEFGAVGLIPDRRIRGTVATSVDSGMRMVATCRRPRCSPGMRVGEAVKALGPSLTAGGIVLVLVGVLAWTGALAWLGNLPGDIRIVRGNTRIYIPFASMLLISLALNVLVWLFLWLSRR